MGSDCGQEGCQKVLVWDGPLDKKNPKTSCQHSAHVYWVLTSWRKDTATAINRAQCYHSLAGSLYPELCRGQAKQPAQYRRLL